MKQRSRAVVRSFLTLFAMFARRPRASRPPGNPSGAWPVSAPAGGAGAEWLSETCNLNACTSGAAGGCILGVHQNRTFAYDQLDTKARSWTEEAKLNSTFDGHTSGFFRNYFLTEPRIYGVSFRYGFAD